MNLSRDIKIATVYLSIFNSKNISPEDIFMKIIDNKKIIRFKMADKLKSKYVPEIKFELDKSLKKYDDINRLLKS